MRVGTSVDRAALPLVTLLPENLILELSYWFKSNPTVAHAQVEGFPIG
jgi:hypothetical protein